MSTVQKTTGKSSEELIEEAKSIQGKTQAVYVPQICEAIRQENPNFTLSEIQDAVIRRCVRELGWAKHSIQNNWGEFARSYEKSPNYRKTANLKKAEQSKQILRTFDKIPTPRITHEPEPKYTPVDDEELDKELHSMQMGKFGDTGKSVRELYGDITHHCNGLFEVMTQKEIPYADNEDLMLDYIKPSREHWRSLMLEFDEAKRTRTHNCLSFIAELIEDRLEILKDVENK